MYFVLFVSKKKLFDYFNSTRVANHLLAKIAKEAFVSADTKQIVGRRETCANLGCKKLILRYKKLNQATWKVCDMKKSGNSTKMIINLDIVFKNPFQRSIKKLAKKRNLNDKNLQIQNGRKEDGKNPFKKRRVAKKRSSLTKKGYVSVSCKLKNSTRRSSRLATKAQNKQKNKDSAKTNFNCSEIVSQPSERTKYQCCSKSKLQFQYRIQNLISSSNVSSLVNLLHFKLKIIFLI